MATQFTSSSSSPTSSVTYNEEGQSDSAVVPKELEVDHENTYEDKDAEPSMQDPDRSTAFLDGLRGFAAVCVFIQHYIPGFTMQSHEHGFGQLDPEDGKTRYYVVAGLPFVRILFNGGNAAVNVFFVLSGYVLCKAPLRMLRDGRLGAVRTSLLSAVIRRPIRLYLPVFAVSFLTVLVMHLPGPVMEISPFAPPEPSVWLEILQWWRYTWKFFQPFQIHDSDSSPYYYNSVAWTLPIELKGSFFVYGLLALFLRSGGKPGKGALFFSLLAILLLHVGRWAWSCFTFGLVLAIVDVNGLDWRIYEQHVTTRARHIFFLACFWIGWYFLSEPAVGAQPIYSFYTPGWGLLTHMIPGTYNIHHYYRYWQTWGALLVVYAVLRIQWLQKFFRSRPMAYLGKVSFMLYLVHLPFFRVFGDRLSKAVVDWMPYGWEEPKHEFWYDRLIRVPHFGPAGMDTRFMLAMAINLPVTCLVAHAATKYIDMPSVRLGKRLAHNLGLDIPRTSGEQGGINLPRWTR